MSRFLTIIFLLLLPVSIRAQEKATSSAVINGTIVDESGKPMPAASVAIHDVAMTKVITGASSKENGNFEITVAPGQYVVKVTFLSYKTHQEEIDIKPGEKKSLGTIKLQPRAEQMQELFVRGEKSHMQMNFDKRTFNVGKDITSLGGSAVNVLDNVPSLSTDIDGNISLRGNQSVRVLINGKPSNMVSNGVDALRSIPANMIKKIEIITNPSSKYAAEGSGGIINIVLKKDRRLGFNGSVAAGTGYPQDHEVSTNVNYRTGNINWFFNGSIGYRADPEGGSSFQRFSGPDTTYMYRENTNSDETEWDGDLRLGMDYNITDTQILTATTFINLEKGNDNEDVKYTDLQYAPGAFDGDVLGQVLRENDEDSHDKDVDFSLRYENKIKGEDHKLTADARFELSRENSNTNIQESVLQGEDAPLYQRTEDGEDENEFRVNVEYKRPLGGKGKLEAGLRTNAEWQDNSYFVEQREDGIWMPLGAYNDNFKYLENVNAAYLNLGTKLGAFSGQVGVRAENTRIRTEIKSTHDVNNQNYINLFPSLFLNYAFNDKNSIQLSYSRRLSRPHSRWLLPFSDFSNSRSQFVGNPDLTPEYSNSYEAGYLRTWKSGSVLTSIYYRYRTDVTERITEQKQGVLRRFPINLATEKAWGIEFSVDQDLFNGLSITGNANLYQSNRDGRYQQQVFESEAQSFQARMRLKWELSDAWNYQASLRYRAPHETTQGRRNGDKRMNTAVSREFWDGKAILSVSVRDVFNSRNFNNTVTTDGNPNTDFYSQRKYRWSSRSVSLNFRYFFGGAKQQSGSHNR